MKSLRLLAITLLASTLAASAAVACDNHKSAASSTSATTASATKLNGKVPSVAADGGCSAEAATYKNAAQGAAGCNAAMSAQCTAAMRAACEKNAATTAAAAATGCSMKGAATAGGKDAYMAHSNTATVASMSGGMCNAKGASMAKGSACPMHGSATAAGMDHCAGAKGAAVTASAAGMICSEHMNGVAHDCSACEVWADCDKAVQKLGARTQVVSLKNGAMIVYTADSDAEVKALQSLISKRNDKMTSALSANSDKKLCDECRQLRGAMASGKLHREVVNVERGCMTLITANDQGLVQKIRTMTSQPIALR